jgi:hypothetical protein
MLSRQQISRPNITSSQSAWLREAISDLDPSCSRITIIARPAAPRQIMGHSQSASSYNPRTERERAGMFRLEAVGNFGKTEVSVYSLAASPCFCLLLLDI